MIYKRVKRFLKDKDKLQIKSLLDHPDFTEQERWVICYTFGENRMVVNTCMKLYLSQSQFHKIQNTALLKLYYIYHI